VFQHYALYPHFRVHGNIAFYFRLRRWTEEAVESKVLETSRIMGIGFEKLLGRMPRSLSGGEKQRVALARCLNRSPRVLLLDEPFSNLDAALRLQTRSEVKKLADRFGLSTIFVTHDQGAAVAMGHRIAVMQHGHIEQVGTYHELYQEPANTFVAGFLGSPPMNFFAARRQVQLVAGDVTDLPLILRATSDARPSRVVHLAATLGASSETNALRALQVNCEGTINIFEAALAFNVQQVVWASSIAVFGPPRRRPAGEIANDAFHQPNDLYGACKAMNEQLARHAGASAAWIALACASQWSMAMGKP
jgi:ABC-type sugar transport system ATPase subunit